METVEITETILTFPESEDDDNHIVCCRNDDVSVCGLDVSQAEWVPEDSIDCQRCRILGDNDYCPLGLICI